MRRTLNLGILAHVDAGKTSLTERLLYAAGVITEIGSVDRGNTQTDTLELERQRGITIKSAVASFSFDDVNVNLIDTPGHPDFIAEVERVLSVLDGAVLVISAVEGVQAQTRVLMRTLQRLSIPTLIFVNKIDRTGARYDGVLREIATKLTPAIIAMGAIREDGTRQASFAPFDEGDEDFQTALVEALAERDEALLAAYIDNEAGVSLCDLLDKLAGQSRQALAHPVYFGSAITGAGVDALIAGLTRYLPAAAGDPDAPLSGSIFKIERGRAGEKIAYARMFAGTVRVRDLVQFGRESEDKVTALEVFDGNLAVRGDAVSAGQIGKLWGLAGVQIGDAIGRPHRLLRERHFAPPTLEAVVIPQREEDKPSLHLALGQLAEQDPLIGLRRDEVRGLLSVSLYGEVQKEVIQSTLASDYQLDVDFSETTIICVERPAATAEAVEILYGEGNPFQATVGLRIEPGPPGSGIEFRLDVATPTVPLHVYKSVDAFAAMMEEYVRDTLREGLCGWQVTDCVVTMIDCLYSSPDGGPSTRGPLSTAADFRKLTPLVVMDALRQAGTEVCEPVHRYQIDVPADTLGAVLPALMRLNAVPETPQAREAAYLLEGEIPAAKVHELQQRLKSLTRGEGLLETAFERYVPVTGPAPARPHSEHSPINRKEYLLHVSRRG
jgi:ribosomal protection tetracycline resistance protein